MARRTVDIAYDKNAYGLRQRIQVLHQAHD